MSEVKIGLKAEVRELENGLKWVHYHVSFLKTVFMSYYVRAGSANEYKRNFWGISHFLEHMVFNGSKNYPDNEVVQRELAGQGIIENAWTFCSMTNYYMVSHTRSMEFAFDVLTDSVFRPLLTDEKTEKERGIIQEERKAKDNQPERVLKERIAEQIFAGSTYAHPILGYADTIAGIKDTDMQEYHGIFYSPNNCWLVTYGGAAMSEMEGFVVDGLAGLERADIPKHDIVSKHEGAADSEIKLDLDVTSAYYTYYLMLPQISNMEEYLALLFFAACLDYGRGGLLNERFVLEKSLVSCIESDLIAFRDNSLLIVQAAMDGKLCENVQNGVLSLVDGMVSGSGSSGSSRSAVVSAAAFERARGYVEGMMLRKMESVWLPSCVSLGNVVRLNFLLGLDWSLGDIVDAVRSAKMDDVMGMWGEMFDLKKMKDGFVK